ncbi:glycosyltransferase family 1 protein [Sphingomonas sediminicola]|uniref:glycosyltransferase family 4 protein n=1 Tax=Sphingomonas sediminicola TaxID=386874 RepID=UPI003CE94CE2
MTGHLSIGVDATTWWNKRGFGRFTRGQLGAMLDDPRGHRFVLFVDQEPVDEMIRPNVDIVRVETSATVTDSAVADGSRSVGDLLSFRREASSRPLDVFWFPAVYSWYPVSGRIPTVVTFHDAIAEHFTRLVLPTLRGRLFWNLKVWLAKRSARHIATVSEAAREEIVRYLHIPRRKISVILEAADEQFHPITDEQELRAARSNLGLPLDRRLLLYVGGLAPHKNLAGLIEGFARAIGNGGLDDLDLVLAGDPKGGGFHSNVEELRALIAEHGLEDRVHFPGFVPEPVLPALYSGAVAVAMPAFSEGFGLPAAEAIACGTPVIATEGGAVSEVVGRAGLFFDPRNPDDIAEAIAKIAGDPALLAHLKMECLPRAAELSWSHSASAMMDLLEAHARGRA